MPDRVGSPEHSPGMEFPRMGRRQSVLRQAAFVDPNYVSKSYSFPAHPDESGDEDILSATDAAEGATSYPVYPKAPLTLEILVPDITLDFEKFARVLVIYSGGTIGMQMTDNGEYGNFGWYF